MGLGGVTPQRVVRPVRRHWRIVGIGLALGVVIIVALVAGAIAVTGRAVELNEAIYQQCVRDETQDAVIVEQLRAARRRLRLSLPPGNIERIYQDAVLTDGINALEPPDESPCQPPEGVGP